MTETDGHVSATKTENQKYPTKTLVSRETTVRMRLNLDIWMRHRQNG